MKFFRSTTNSKSTSVVWLSLLILLPLLHGSLSQSSSGSQDPTSFIGTQCYNDSKALVGATNESVSLVYVSFFNPESLAKSCVFGNPVRCTINGTSLYSEIEPRCTNYGGTTYQQNFTVNCTFSSGGVSVSSATVTAINFAGCSPKSCNLSVFESYNLNPAYKGSFATIATGIFGGISLSNCQFSPLAGNVEVPASSPSNSPPTSGANRHHSLNSVTTSVASAAIGIISFILGLVAL